ncbi:hypothetical protein JX265_000031 [Neoarthrinium moseri]|uniref:4'-phosphopantetheinyl transferase domain-containing protein n=1 Tax=Neoarthrinium moseri TaxID=1658444 RepID=A0A9Q0AWG2_9PEZI|nr:uncharacterized protein JN550_001266 [Neoarthrinium moseri]KAI1845790.1 hypothetical protein JX266_008155 [Neoarthrinium moseri]KAI1877194.1 hypothetical protein JN550_001266 [Neoarthrinium moseri]KAI1881205.1 hypothetical protein JX265_000031 [Neoarthrinium moseri]
MAEGDSLPEQHDAGGYRDPAMWKAAEFMAGRFAAKEAAIKAHHQLKITFQDIEIVSGTPARGFKDGAEDSPVQTEPGVGEGSLSSGPPTAIVRLPTSSQGQSALLSISHDGEYASAVCLAVHGDQGIFNA